MSQRIRYKKTSQGVLTSRRHFTTAAGVEVLVELDLTSKKYRILDSVSNAEVVPPTGNTKNTSVLKIQAKRGLEALGVTFTEEVRTRGNTQPNEAVEVG